MTNNNIKYLLAAMLGATAWTGCSDFLEPENKANLDADTYYVTDEAKAELRTNLYYSMKEIATNIDLQEWGTDLYDVTRGAQPSVYQSFILTPEDKDVTSYYQNLYAMIMKANAVLEYAADVPQYVAEAKFMRAYGHFLLSQHFGAVPYIDHYIQSADKNYPRTPLATLYADIIAELESIVADAALPATDATHAGYISQRAAKTLLAKVYLAAGWDLETTLTDAAQGTCTTTTHAYFDKAAQMAVEAIDGQSLSMSFEDKWSPAHEGNDEEIFAVQYSRSGFPGDELKGGHTLQNTYGSQYGSPVDNGLKSCSGKLVPSAKSIYLWAKGDERYDATFMTTIYNGMGTWGTSGYYAYYNATDEQKSKNVIAGRYFPWYTTTTEAEAYIDAHRDQFKQGSCKASCYVVIMADPAVAYKFDSIANQTKVTKDYATHLKGEGMTAVTHCVKKFDDPETPQANNATGYRDIVLFHLSDLYLTAAEAYLMAGDESSAINYINAVRTRARASAIPSFDSYKPDYATSEDFTIRPIDLVLDERARELYAERTRWMDLRRTRQLVRYNVEFNPYVSSMADMSNSKGEVKWYRPIPASEIETNTAISSDDQNEGY